MAVVLVTTAANHVIDSYPTKSKESEYWSLIPQLPHNNEEQKCDGVTQSISPLSDSNTV